MKTILKLLDPGRPWLLGLILVALLGAMFAPDVRAADAVDPNYQALLNTAENIRKAESTAVQAVAAGQAACAEEISRAVNGIYVDSETKVVTVATDNSAAAYVARVAAAGFIALNCRGGGTSGPTFAPINVPAPPPVIETGFWAGLKATAKGGWEMFTFAADKALSVYGIRTNKQVVIESARINKDLQLGLSADQSATVIALGGNTERVAVASVGALAAAASRPQTPGTQITVSGNTGPVNVGNGTQNNSSNNPTNPTRVCTTNTTTGAQTCT